VDKGDDDNKDAVGEVAMVDLLKENDDKAETALDNDRDMLEDVCIKGSLTRRRSRSS
tara:strand:+ start:412 stop:582 length:171 start_codon:yes stop_codon:yes gene_type:complete